VKTGKTGLALIKRFEGLMTRAYIDPVGIWTIGYGHTAKAGPPSPVKGMKITAGEAEEILRRDLIKYERAVLEAVQVPLTQNQFDALVSFTFNVGPTNLRNSTLLRLLNARHYDAVPAQLRRWDKGTVGGKKVVLKGLTRRRAAEAALWSTADGARTPPDVVPTTPAKGWAVNLWRKITGA
jgi:lysozyme